MGSYRWEKNSLDLLYVDTETVWRGGQEQLLSLMVGMTDRGNRVYLAAPKSSLLTKKARAAGVIVFDFKQRSEFSFIAFYRLLKILRKKPF